MELLLLVLNLMVREPSRSLPQLEPAPQSVSTYQWKA
jgi:hypothetical protein